MKDEWFIRGKVPMTKSEVRAISLSKLELKPDSVVYDIGAGTGSVSIEAAIAVRDGQVYAIEQKREAVELILANREKFGVKNLTVIEGKAPEALLGLPAPTHAFIGGSCGQMESILQTLLEANREVRIVLNLIAMETIASVIELLKEIAPEAEMILVQTSKAERIGSYHLMRGQNPVYVIAFGGTE